MRLKDTDPDQFAEYVQMAADAAKLAEDRPDVFEQLKRGDGAAGATDEYPPRSNHATAFYL